jgi:hypothetical protein
MGLSHLSVFNIFILGPVEIIRQHGAETKPDHSRDSSCPVEDMSSQLAFFPGCGPRQFRHGIDIDLTR